MADTNDTITAQDESQFDAALNSEPPVADPSNITPQDEWAFDKARSTVEPPIPVGTTPEQMGRMKDTASTVSRDSRGNALFWGAAEKAVRPVSLGGMGNILAGATLDQANIGESMRTGVNPIRNTMAAISSEPLPRESEIRAEPQSLVNAVKLGSLGVLKSGPALSAGSLLGGGPIAFGLAFGSSGAGETGSYWEGAKSGVIGAVFPVVGKWARGLGGSVVKSLVDRGLMKPESETAAKSIEFALEQAGMQAFSEVINLPEYAQMTPEQVKYAMIENSVALGIFALPGLRNVADKSVKSEYARVLAETIKSNPPPVISDPQTALRKAHDAATAPQSGLQTTEPVGPGVSSPVDAFIATTKATADAVKRQQMDDSIQKQAAEATIQRQAAEANATGVAQSAADALAQREGGRQAFGRGSATGLPPEPSPVLLSPNVRAQLAAARLADQAPAPINLPKEVIPNAQEMQGQETVVPQPGLVKAEPGIYPVIKKNATVDGRVVRGGVVPNMSSIEASVDKPEILPGIREVPMSDFTLTGKHYSIEGQKKIDALAEAIKGSGEITPLIVVRDAEGSYILEGATRADALFKLGAKSFPAKVVIDRSEVKQPAAVEAKPAAPQPPILDYTRALEMGKRFGIKAEDAHFFNVAIEAVKADPGKWTTLAEGVQKEALRAAVAAKGNLETVGDLHLAKKVAALYFPEGKGGLKKAQTQKESSNVQNTKAPADNAAPRPGQEMAPPQEIPQAPKANDVGGKQDVVAAPTVAEAPAKPVVKNSLITEPASFPSLLEFAKSKLPASVADKITSESQVESYRAQWEKEKNAATVTKSLPPSTSEFQSLHPTAKLKFNAAWNANDAAAMKELLLLKNRGLRAEFANRVGLPLPKTESGTRMAVESWARGTIGPKVETTPAKVEPVAPAVETKPKAVETPPVLAKEETKAQEPVKQQKAEFDPKVAKAQKKFLLDEIDKAIAEAPEGYDFEATSHWPSIQEAERIKNFPNNPPADQLPIAVNLAKKYGIEITGSDTAWSIGNKIEESARREAYGEMPHITIEVPGDGTFSIVNNKTALKAFQERAANFPTTIPRVSKPSTPRGTPTAPAPVGKLDAESAVKTAEMFTTTDDGREILKSVYSNGKATIATDGRRMIQIDKGNGGSEKQPVLIKEGKTTKAGVKPEDSNHYPNYKQVIPADADLTTVAKGLDAARLFTLVKQAAEATSEKSNAVKMFLNNDGSLGFTAESTEQSYSGNMQEGARLVGAYNPQYLMDIFNAARKLGSDKVDLHVDLKVGSEHSPMVITAKGMKAVIMPMRTGSTIDWVGGLTVENFGSKIAPVKPVSVTKEQAIATIDVNDNRIAQLVKDQSEAKTDKKKASIQAQIETIAQESDALAKQHDLTFKAPPTEAPAAAPVEAPAVQAATDIIARLEAKKIKPGDESLSSLIPGLDPNTFRSVWNTALDVAITAIKAGRSIAEAVNAAVAHIRSLTTSPFDEAAVADTMRRDLEVRRTDAAATVEGKAKDTLEKGFAHTITVNPLARSLWDSASTNARRYLRTIGRSLGALDTAETTRQDNALPPLDPRKPGETAEDWAKRLTDDPVQQDTLRWMAGDELKGFRKEAATLTDKTAAAGIELAAMAEDFKAHSEEWTNRAVHFDIMAEDAFHGYRNKLQQNIDGLLKLKTLNIEQQTQLDAWKHELATVNKWLSSGALKSAFKAAEKVLTPEDLANPEFTNKNLADKVLASNPEDVARDHLNLVVRMLRESDTLVNDIAMVKAAKTEGVKRAVKDLINDAGQVKVGTLRKLMDKYAHAKGEAAIAWNLLRKANRQFNMRVKRYEGMVEALNVMDKIIAGPDYQRDMTDLSDFSNFTEPMLLDVKDPGSNIHDIRIPNPNPGFEGQSVRIHQWEGMTEEQVTKQMTDLGIAHGWLTDYAQNGIDPVRRRSALHDAVILESKYMNPDYLPSTGKAIRPLHWLRDTIHLINRVTNAISLEHIARLIPGGPGKFLQGIALRRADAVSRGIGVYTRLSFPTQEAANLAAKAHGMSVEEWEIHVANPLLHYFSNKGLKPAKVGETLEASGEKILPQDMIAARAMSDYFDEMHAVTLPKNDPSVKQSPILIEDRAHNLFREARKLTRLMLPRRFDMKVAKIWADAVLSFTGENFNPEAMAKWADGDAAFERWVMSHMITVRDDPTYRVKSSLKPLYREYFIRRSTNPEDYHVDNLADLADRLFKSQDPDAENVLSTDSILEAMAGEWRQAARNIKGGATETSEPVGSLRPSVDVKGFSRFLNTARGDTVAPMGVYDYSLATDSAQMRLYGDITRPYLIETKEAVTSAHDALAKTISETEELLKGGATVDPKALSGLFKTKQDAGQMFLNLEEQKRLLATLGHINEQMANYVNTVSANVSESMWPYRLAARGITGQLLGVATAWINNTTGPMARVAQVNLLIDDRHLPWVHVEWADRIFRTLTNFPVGRGFATAGTAIAESLPDYAKIAAHFVARTAGSTPQGKAFLKDIRDNPAGWSEMAKSFARLEARAQSDYATFSRLGIIQRIEFLNTWAANWNLSSTGGRLGGDPSFKGQMRSIVNTINVTTSTPIVAAGENIGNQIGVYAMRRNVARLEANLAKAIEQRHEIGKKATEKGQKITDSEIFNTADPGQIKERSYRWNDLLGPAVRLDKLVTDFVDRYEAAVGEDKHAVHLLEGGDAEYFDQRAANLINRGTEANRPLLFKGPVTKMFTLLWNYSFWMADEMSQGKAPLIGKNKNSDIFKSPTFLVTASQMAAFVLLAAATSDLKGWASEFFYGKERSIPGLSKARSLSDAAMYIALNASSYMPMMAGLLMSIPYTTGTSKYNMPTGFNMVLPQYLNDAMNTMRTIGQTGEWAAPLGKLAVKWMPNLQMVSNRLDVIRGTRNLADAIIDLRRAELAKGIDSGKASAMGIQGVKTPASPYFERIVNALNMPDGPDWGKINQLMPTAIALVAERMMKSNPNADPATVEKEATQSAYRSVMARAPMQSINGKQLTDTEIGAVLGALSDDEKARITTVEGNFSQFASTVGTPGPASFTNPTRPATTDRLSARAVMPAGGGGTTSQISRPVVSGGLRSASIARPAIGSGRIGRGLSTGSARIGRGLGRIGRSTIRRARSIVGRGIRSLGTKIRMTRVAPKTLRGLGKRS